MIVTQIDQIDDAEFDRMYVSNRDQLVSNIGFDDIHGYRETFKRPEALKFRAVNESEAVVAYFVGEPSDANTAYVYNIITESPHILPLTIEPSAILLKSLGYTHVEFCGARGTATYNYAKRGMYCPNFYEYVSEMDIGNYYKVKLRLV